MPPSSHFLAITVTIMAFGGNEHKKILLHAYFATLSEQENFRRTLATLNHRL